MDPAEVTAREYLRVSQDRSGRARSIEEQHDDNERAGERHGFRLNGEAYSDVSVSASRFSRKVRGDFARLLADLQTGRFGAQILVIWESSRGSRRVGEWATLVDLLQDAGAKVHVTSHGRTYDPANHRDRRTLMEDAVDSEYQSGKQSVEIARALAANAEHGLPHGRILYGYRRQYRVLPSGRRELVAQLRDEAEAPNVEELFRRLYEGHSLHAIAADWKRSGIRTRTGKVFTPQHLRDMALRPAYGGYRTHIPGASAGGVYRGPLPANPNAAWPALVDRTVFWQVRRMLLSPERRTSRPGRGVHLLSMIARCGECDDGALTVRYRSGDRMYVCRARYCVGILADALDGHAEDVMLAYLAQPDVAAQLTEVPEAEVSAVRAELAGARAELESLRAAGRARKVSVGTLLAVEPGLIERVEELERSERELTTPSELAWLLDPGEAVERRWAAAEMPARRVAAKILCSPSVLGTLRVIKTPTPGRRAAEVKQRVTWER